MAERNRAKADRASHAGKCRCYEERPAKGLLRRLVLVALVICFCLSSVVGETAASQTFQTAASVLALDPEQATRGAASILTTASINLCAVAALLCGSVAKIKPSAMAIFSHTCCEGEIFGRKLTDRTTPVTRTYCASSFPVSNCLNVTTFAFGSGERPSFRIASANRTGEKSPDPVRPLTSISSPGAKSLACAQSTQIPAVRSWR